MKKWIVLLVIFVVVYRGVPLSAQEMPGDGPEFQKYAQSTMTFLNINVGGRGVGMGGAFSCMENDVNALFWNPAGIAKIKKGVLSLNHTQWIADMKQYALAAAYGTKSMGTFGVTFLMMDNGSIERTIPDNSLRGFSVDGTFTVGQWAAGLAYAKQLTDKFSIGGQVKYVYQDLGSADIVEPYVSAEGDFSYKLNEDVSNDKGTVAFDFGTLYYFGFKDLRFGMSFRNFSRPVTYSFESFNLPITFKVGVAMNMLSLLPEITDHQLQVAIEPVYPYDHEETIHAGCEYLFKNVFALRTGFRTNSGIGAYAMGFGLTPGAFKGVNFSLDYAYSNAEEVFGTIQRFSFGFTF